MRICTIAGVDIEMTYHAWERLSERMPGTEDIQKDIKGARHLEAGRDGLDAIKGESGTVYLIRLVGLLGCPPVQGTIVTVLTWDVARRVVDQVWSGKGRKGWGSCPARVWEPFRKKTLQADANAPSPA